MTHSVGLIRLVSLAALVCAALYIGDLAAEEVPIDFEIPITPQQARALVAAREQCKDDANCIWKLFWDTVKNIRSSTPMLLFVKEAKAGYDLVVCAAQCPPLPDAILKAARVQPTVRLIM